MNKFRIFICVLGLIGVFGLIVLVTLAGDQLRTAKPLISKLSESGTNTVKITIGSDAGVKVGDIFDAYQENRQIAKLKVTKIEPEQSTAEITDIHPTKELATGDIVIRDVTLQFVRRLRSNSVVATPAQMGRQFAEADISSGINRILYYGKPWSAGKPLIDQETAYPVTITDGCAVTKDFTLLIDEYNLAMREHFRKQ